jgi:hypothetical protein
MSRLDHTRLLLRRFQLVVGLGFVSCAAGLLLSLAIGNRLREVIPNLHPLAVAQIVAMAIRQLWEYAVLPLFCYAAARLFPVSPWRTAAGAVATGELFLMALDYFTGMSGVWLHVPLLLFLRLAAIGGGISLAAFAIKRAREAAERTERAALEAAEKKRTQYDEFLREAERIAALRGESAAGPSTLEPLVGPGATPVRAALEVADVPSAEPAPKSTSEPTTAAAGEPPSEPIRGTGTDGT